MNKTLINYLKSPVINETQAAQFIKDCVASIPAFNTESDFNSYVPPLGTPDECNILNKRLNECRGINTSIADVAHYEVLELQKISKKARKAGKLPKAQKIIKLSKEFTRLLKSYLTPAEMKLIIEKNKAQDDFCATHEYLDANMVMREAFKNVLFYEPNPENDTDAYLWNEAWGLSKNNQFN